MELVWRSVSDKHENQDRVAVFENRIFVVADGVGGRFGGAQAAQCVVDGIEKRFSRTKMRSWSAVLSEIDEEIARNPEAGETTAVVAEVFERRGGFHVRGAAVGDSVAWIFDGEKFFDLTQNAVRKPFLGYGGAKITVFERKFSGVLLLASDGISKYAAPETLSLIHI